MSQSENFERMSEIQSTLSQILQASGIGIYSIVHYKDPRVKILFFFEVSTPDLNESRSERHLLILPHPIFRQEIVCISIYQLQILVLRERIIWHMLICFQNFSVSKIQKLYFSQKMIGLYKDHRGCEHIKYL